MERVRHQGKRIHAITYGMLRDPDERAMRPEQHLPTVNSSRKNTESIARRIMILFDFEKPMIKTWDFCC